MLKTKSFEFDRKGRITVYKSINAQRVMGMCVMHARRKKTRKPFQWRVVPTLTN